MERNGLGFSLVELSIVLVILGLLTGGILAGQSLIRAAQVRSVVAEFQRHQSAAQSFREKYMAFPGDMSAATRFWGRAASTADCVTNSAAALATPGTCDGNGDGSIAAAVAGQSGEDLQFWKQLALAGLIEGGFTGVAPNPVVLTAGINTPASKLNSTAVWYTSSCCAGGSTSFYLANGYGRNFRLFNALVKPEEAWNIDTKIDDGKPAFGFVVAGSWSTCTTATSWTDTTAAVYRLDDNTTTCSLFFPNAF